MKTYGLVGKTLGYSFSKSFFEAYFKKHALDAEFVNFEIDQIELIQEIFNKNISGLTITIPYKEAIIPYLDLPIGTELERVNGTETFRQISN